MLPLSVYEIKQVQQKASFPKQGTPGWAQTQETKLVKGGSGDMIPQRNMEPLPMQAVIEF